MNAVCGSRLGLGILYMHCAASKEPNSRMLVVAAVEEGKKTYCSLQNGRTAVVALLLLRFLRSCTACYIPIIAVHCVLLRLGKV